ncbi:MAG: hypothetical protein HC809_11330 [Gammaproteobacteria bacterium]|nr:hypothetical protein [Gammaproteobacteria bacterium]
MLAFDALIGMAPRDPRWIGYTADDPMLVLTGHGAAFGTSSRLPQHLSAAQLRLGETLVARLRELDQATLMRALPMLNARQIKAVLARRDALLAKSVAVAANDE